MSIVNAQFQDWKGNIYHFETSADMIKGANETFAPLEHNHDERYYTETEIDKMAENLKEYVVNGKEKIANAINDKKNNNQMNKDNTFDELANGIRSIETGCPINGIIKRYKVKQGETIKAGDFINLIEGKTEAFDKFGVLLINEKCDIRIVQYNENVLILAWYIQKNNTDYIYICYVRAENGWIKKGEDKLVCSVNRINADRIVSEQETRSYINDFNFLDKVGNTDTVILTYGIYETFGNKISPRHGSHTVIVKYNDDSISIESANTILTVSNAKPLNHITEFFDNSSICFGLLQAETTTGSFPYILLFKTLNNEITEIGKSSISYSDKKQKCIGIKMYGRNKFIVLFKQVDTDKYSCYIFYYTPNPIEGQAHEVLVNAAACSFSLPPTNNIFLGMNIIEKESIIIYGDTQLYAKFLKYINSDTISVTDTTSQIIHDKIYKVFDSGTIIDKNNNARYCNTNVGNTLIYYNDDGKNYFAHLGIGANNSLVESYPCVCPVEGLQENVYILEYVIRVSSDKLKFFVMSDDNLIVINYSTEFLKAPEIEAVLKLEKLHIDMETKKLQVFYINNQYVIIDSNRNVVAFLIDSDENTGIIKSNKAETEVCNATYEELFAGVAKTSGKSGQYIDAYVSKCRQ